LHPLLRCPRLPCPLRKPKWRRFRVRRPSRIGGLLGAIGDFSSRHLFLCSFWVGFDAAISRHSTVVVQDDIFTIGASQVEVLRAADCIHYRTELSKAPGLTRASVFTRATMSADTRQARSMLCGDPREMSPSHLNPRASSTSRSHPRHLLDYNSWFAITESISSDWSPGRLLRRRRLCHPRELPTESPIAIPS
jgi:hypothetical protein